MLCLACCSETNAIGSSNVLMDFVMLAAHSSCRLLGLVARR